MTSMKNGFPRVLPSSIQLSEGGHVSRSIMGDPTQVLVVKEQTDKGLSLGEFLDAKDRYIGIDHKASIGTNLAGAKQNFARGKIADGIQDTFDVGYHLIKSLGR
jgi:hypothetical protein